MSEAFKKRFENADEVRQVPKANVEVLNLGEATAMRGTFEPGWKWSECVKPIVGTNSCEVEHLGYVVSGTMMIRMDDGSEITFNPGDAAYIPPGHDAWVPGNEPCVFLDFQGGTTYAKPQSSEAAG
jgi:hypothetical protein